MSQANSGAVRHVSMRPARTGLPTLRPRHRHARHLPDVRLCLREVSAMAKARASHRWTDGSITTFEVEVAMSYPDALDQAKHVALVGFREMLEVMQTEDES